jgi:hypothetical protein
MQRMLPQRWYASACCAPHNRARCCQWLPHRAAAPPHAPATGPKLAWKAPVLKSTSPSRETSGTLETDPPAVRQRKKISLRTARHGTAPR